jgi:two-component system sensor histidine kinase AlgZ
MSSVNRPAVKPVEIVIPDCCNIGVVCRVLLAVNGAVLAATLLQAHLIQAGLFVFVEASVLTELACLSSMLVLCGVRRLVSTISPIGQRIVCVLVPAAVTAFIIRFILSGDLFFGSFTRLTPVEGMLIGGLFGVVLQHYFELRTRAISPVLVEARLQALQARIRPHFLFNSLNAVLSLIRSEPRRAEATLEDLADLFRVLMRDARDIISLEDEIRLCRQYLSIEKIRLGERLQVQWKTKGINDSVLRRAQIPALLLQPLLENAVHYGVELIREPVQIQIHIIRSMDRIEIIIRNPTVRLDSNDSAANDGNHMALQNIRERLALLYDVEAQLTTMETPGFFEVRLRFPYRRGP